MPQPCFSASSSTETAERPWKQKSQDSAATVAGSVAQHGQEIAQNWDRANSARTPEVRKKMRETKWDELKALYHADSAYWNSIEKAAAIPARTPWDIRGPPGPSADGPSIWRGQKFREGSQRFANRAGKSKKKWAYYNMKKKSGLTGIELHYYHPKNKDGHWKHVPDPDA